MPIRTPRGRAAAYRPLWQWPLRSPGRLVGCLLVLIALGFVAHSVFGLLPGRATGIFFGTGPTAGPSATPTAAAPAPAEVNRLPPVPELTPSTLPPADAPRAALTTATRWAQAWARHPAGGAQAWVNGLRPYTTDEYLAVLATVDPANVPATRVTGPARAVLVSPRSVRVQVPTDAVTLIVLVVSGEDGQWKVAGYDRADAGAGPGPSVAGPAEAPGR